MHNFDFDTPATLAQENFVKNNTNFLKQAFGNSELSPLFIADMDFKIAPSITQAYKDLADRGVFAYEFPPEGLADSLVDWYNRKHGLSLSPSGFELIHGVLTAIAILVQEFSPENGKVVIQTPVYHQFANGIKMNNRQVIENPLQFNEGRYTMDLEQLESTFQSENPEIFLLCNPHNPVGRVWSKEELSLLVELCKKHNVLLISDEIHADIVYPGSRFTSLACFEYENIISLLGSPAKTFGMQGAAAGFIYSNNETLKSRYKKRIESMYLNHVPSIVMYGIKAAYDHGDSWLEALMDYLQITQKWIIDFVNTEMSPVKAISSEGTYQLWLDFNDLHLSKEELDDLLFNKAKVGLAPGHWFGENGNGFARINYASPLAYIQSEMKKLQEAVQSLE